MINPYTKEMPQEGHISVFIRSLPVIIHQTRAPRISVLDKSHMVNNVRVFHGVTKSFYAVCDRGASISAMDKSLCTNYWSMNHSVLLGKPPIIHSHFRNEGPVFSHWIEMFVI